MSAFFGIITSLVVEAAKVLDRPGILPVEDHGDFAAAPFADNTGKLLQHFTGFSNLTEDPRVFVAAVIYNGAVIFFVTATSLTPLEILHAVCAVSHRL